MANSVDPDQTLSVECYCQPSGHSFDPWSDDILAYIINLLHSFYQLKIGTDRIENIGLFFQQSQSFIYFLAHLSQRFIDELHLWIFLKL